MPLRPTASAPPTVPPGREGHELAPVRRGRRPARPPGCRRRSSPSSRRGRSTSTPPGARTTRHALDRPAAASRGPVIVTGPAAADGGQARSLRPMRPAGTACTSAQRLPAGSTLWGLATPSGSNAARRRACSVEVGGGEQQGHAGRASRARCRARPTAPRRRPRCTRTISSPAACTRSSTPGSRSSNTSSGCRLPSPAWNTFMTIRSWRSAIS